LDAHSITDKVNQLSFLSLKSNMHIFGYNYHD